MPPEDEAPVPYDLQIPPHENVGFAHVYDAAYTPDLTRCNKPGMDTNLPYFVQASVQIAQHRHPGATRTTIEAAAFKILQAVAPNPVDEVTFRRVLSEAPPLFTFHINQKGAA